jgi:hypothetical protein
MNIKDVLGRIELYTNCDELTLKRIEYLLKEFKPEKEVDEIKIRIREKPIVVVEDKEYVIPTKSIAVFATEYSEMNKVNLSSFRVRNRSKAIVEMKIKFCVAAYKAGYGYSSIGTFLKMHHTSILHLVKDAPQLLTN